MDKQPEFIDVATLLKRWEDFINTHRQDFQERFCAGHYCSGVNWNSHSMGVTFVTDETTLNCTVFTIEDFADWMLAILDAGGW